MPLGYIQWVKGSEIHENYVILYMYIHVHVQCRLLVPGPVYCQIKIDRLTTPTVITLNNLKEHDSLKTWNSLGDDSLNKKV